MKLQKYFSPKRFINCLKYDLYLNGKTYVLALVVLFIILFIVDLLNLNDLAARLEYQTNYFPKIDSKFNVNITFFDRYYRPIFIFFLISGLVISAGTSFSALRSSTNSISYLLLPASILEKYVVHFLLRIVVFTALFFLLYWFTFKCAYVFYGFIEPVSETVKNYGILSVFKLLKNTSEVYLISLAITMCTLFAFAGATYFKKFAIFKSIFVFALVVVFMFLLMVMLSHLFYDHATNEIFAVKLTSYMVYEDVTEKDVFFRVLFIGISLILLPLAYFNLKEREA